VLRIVEAAISVARACRETVEMFRLRPAHVALKSAEPDDPWPWLPNFPARRKRAMRRPEDPLSTVRYRGPIPSVATPVCGLLRFTAMRAA
jgi:hypothetical protein